MTDDQQLTLWVGACRYYMGRRTYAVSDFCDMLRHQWASLPEQTRKIIRRDLEEAFHIDDDFRRQKTEARYLGADCDRAAWEKVRKLWEGSQ